MIETKFVAFSFKELFHFKVARYIDHQYTFSIWKEQSTIHSIF